MSTSACVGRCRSVLDCLLMSLLYVRSAVSVFAPPCPRMWAGGGVAVGWRTRRLSPCFLLLCCIHFATRAAQPGTCLPFFLSLVHPAPPSQHPPPRMYPNPVRLPASVCSTCGCRLGLEAKGRGGCAAAGGGWLLPPANASSGGAAVGRWGRHPSLAGGRGGLLPRAGGAGEGGLPWGKQGWWLRRPAPRRPLPSPSLPLWRGGGTPQRRWCQSQSSTDIPQ